MPIHFRSAPLREPFTFESVGNHWNQEDVARPNGYPLYHYLQSEQGVGRIEIQGKTYLLNEGEGVLIAPGVRHSYRRESREWLTIFATFTGVMEDSISKLLENRAVIFVEKSVGQEIALLLDTIVAKFETPPVEAKALSVDCYHLLMNFVDGVYAGNITNEPLYQKYIEPVIKRMEADFDADLTVEELSAAVYVTPQYLSRLFRRFLGCSTYEYLMRYRISQAKRYLLTKPKMEIQEISRQTGFNSTSHFIAMFKKKTGMTPAEFRAGEM